MKRKTYTVTELAGPKVANRTVKAGATIELTEEEARTELLAGTIALVKEGAEVPGAKDLHGGSKKLEEVRIRATGREPGEAEEEPGPVTAPEVEKTVRDETDPPPPVAGPVVETDAANGADGGSAAAGGRRRKPA